MAEEILKMVNITKRFAGITALDRVQFSCSKGKYMCWPGKTGPERVPYLRFWRESIRRMKGKYISMVKGGNPES